MSSHLEGRATSLMLITLLASVSATAAAGSPPPGERVPTVPITKPLAAPPAPAPPAKGWPHNVLSATVLAADKCGRAPAANEVIVFSLVKFAGSCAVLTPGFYPHGNNLGVGDDTVSSI